MTSMQIVLITVFGPIIVLFFCCGAVYAERERIVFDCRLQLHEQRRKSPPMMKKP